MAVHMEKMSASSSSGIAQRLYDKNVELENRRRRSVQAKVPSDPNAWQQMRENNEAIILEDHSFSEQHNIEHALWQLHYRRIEEFRAHFNSALASNASTTSQAVKVPPRPDRATKIRMQFKTFLSEATGFYHDLMLKIRSKYGLPLGTLSDYSENQMAVDKDRKRSTEMKKGIISCHRCLIYLGDLARYKGLYGEGDSKARDYAAASSYYLQASSLWPSSGNPHHQLAILSTYSGDELGAVYRYFRSLSVDFPCTTARENLVIAFEKNRRNHSQMFANAKTATNGSPVQRTNKGKMNVSNENGTGARDTCITFTTCFVRLNGILFTRTSLETFPDVLSEVSNDLNKLLSTGSKEELNFGTDASDNENFIIRLVSVLISTVHNVTRDSEGKTYADILQRTVLLQNALTAIYDLLGHMLNRCTQLLDPSSSYLLPGILVFVEWIASWPDVAAGSDMNDKQMAARSVFWNHCVDFLNKLLSAGIVDMDYEDGDCFFKMSKYNEGENESYLPLWEDFELRGFLPLQPAQAILDFSMKQHSVGGDSSKEKIIRIKRILAAGKALSNVVIVDRKKFTFNVQVKKFTIGTNPQTSQVLTPSSSLVSPTVATFTEGVRRTAAQHIDSEDEDEVIVFKPVINENRIDIASKISPQNAVDSGESSFLGDPTYYNDLILADEISPPHPQAEYISRLQTPASAPIMPNFQPTTSQSSIWSMNQPAASLVNELKVANSLETNVTMNPAIQETTSLSHPSIWSMNQPAASLVNELEVANSLEMNIMTNPGIQETTSLSHPSIWSMNQPAASLVNELEVANSLEMNSMMNPGKQVTSSLSYPSIFATTKQSTNGNVSKVQYNWGSVPFSGVNSVSGSVSSRRSPVKRPVRHHGPPPGFGSVPSKSLNDNNNISGTNVAAGNPLMDDYRWLDGYQPPSSVGTSGLNQSINYPSHLNAQYNTSFQQNSVEEKQNGWDDLLAFDHLKLQEQLQQPQQLMNGGQQFYPLHSMWTGNYPV